MHVVAREFVRTLKDIYWKMEALPKVSQTKEGLRRQLTPSLLAADKAVIAW